MSVLGLMNPEMQDAGRGGIESPSSTIGDVFSASLEATARNYSTISEPLFTGVESRYNVKKYQELTGRNIYTDAFAASPDPQALNTAFLRNENTDKVNAAVDQQVLKLREQDPEKYKDLKTFDEIKETVKQKAKDALALQGKVISGATGAGSFFGQLGGGLVGGFADPVNLATIPLGAGMAAGIIKTALIDAGVNSGIELAKYPFVNKWQKELGQDYGPSELAANVGMAAVFGGVFGGGVKALSIGLEKLKLPNSVKLSELRERVPDNPELQQALGHEERRLQIEEADPKKYGAVLSPAEQEEIGVTLHEPKELDPAAHQRALEEVDSAINEDRQLNPNELGLSDDQVRALDPEKMDDGLRALHERIVEDSPEEPATQKKKANEIFDSVNEDPEPSVAHQELADLHDSPELIAQEKADFEASIEMADPKERVFMDEEGKDMSIEELRKQFKNDNEYIKAISSCGLGEE